MTVNIGDRKPNKKKQSKPILSAERIQNSFKPAAPDAAPKIRTAISNAVSLTILGPTFVFAR